MTKIQKILFFLIPCLPFLNFYPYAPYGAWTPETTALILTALIIASPSQAQANTINTTQITLLGLISAIILSFAINQPSYPSISIISIFYLLCGYFLSRKIFELKQHSNVLIKFIALGLITGTTIQILVAATQISGLFAIYSNSVQSLSLLIPQPVASTTPYGLIFQRNQFADYIFMGGIAACYLHAEKSINKYTYAILIVLISLFLTFSMSRSVIAYALAATLMTIFFYFKNKNNKLIFYSLLIYIALCFALQISMPKILPLLADYLPSLQEGSGLNRLQTGLDSERKIEWQKAWILFQQNPIFGTGFGTYAAGSVQLKSLLPHSTIYQFSDPLYTHSHNIFLQFLVETGLVGALILFAGALALASTLIRSPYSNQKIFTLLCISTISIHSQFEYPLWYAFFFILFIIFISIEDNPITTINSHYNISKPFSFVIITACGFGLYTNIKLINLSNVEDSPSSQNQSMKMAISLSKNPLSEDLADLFILSNMPLDDKNIDYKIYLSEKLIKFRPSTKVFFRYGIFLAFANKPKQGSQVIDQLLKQNPTRIDQYAADFIPLQNDPRLAEIGKVIRWHIINNPTKKH